ncbi:putative beta-glucosidase I [Lachnellula subtilissima]|uniref:beta-glucosidase n=1 Tax=Lachnellula subtilissima TaxID=602034 RepID=A0A8H8UD77_9HELO|nr:putative beta-glucosidase I [Lachnellula subtilissima]
MGRTPASGVRKRPKPSPHMALDVFSAESYMQQRQSHDWDFTNPFERANSSELQDDQPPSTASGDRESLDLLADDSIGIWNVPTGQQQQRQQQSFKSLSANTGSELDSLGLDPLITTFDNIDFSDVNDGHFEVEESPLDLPFLRPAAAQSSRSSSTTPQKHSQPRQQQPQLQLQTTHLPSTPSSSTPQSYQDSNCGFSQTTGTPGSAKYGNQYWTTQLEGLSRTLQKSPVPLDGTLHHSSQLLPRIGEALRSLNPADISSSATNLILILVCLTQLVTLLELCIPPVLAGPSAADSSDLSLRLGEFQVDRKAQQALQVHILSVPRTLILYFLNFLCSERSFTAGSDFWHTTTIPRLKIPSLCLSDGPNGVRGKRFFNGTPAACLPCATALGATFDSDLLNQLGVFLGQEAKLKGAHVRLGPTINTQRSPLGGRGFESFSEDPYLSGILAGECCKCVKKENIVPTLNILTERALREIYLMPFMLAIINSDSGAIMTAYNKINGTYVSENKLILDVLRKDWKWSGLIMSLVHIPPVRQSKQALTKSIRLVLDKKYATSFWDEIRHSWACEKGTYDILVGNYSSGRFTSKSFMIKKTTWWTGL